MSLERFIQNALHAQWALSVRPILPRPAATDDDRGCLIGDPKKWLEHSDHMPLVFRLAS